MGRTQFLATAAVVGLYGVAYGADIPVKAPPQPVPTPTIGWTGFYLGGNFGGVGLSADAHTHSINHPITGDRQCSTNEVALTPLPVCHLDNVGAVAGVQGGYDWQINTIVLGVAADWTWTDLKANESLFGAKSNPFVTAKVDWLASFRGRVGWAFSDKALFYGTGGVAWARISATAGAGPNGFEFFTNAISTTKTGWVAGGGMEYKLTEHLSAMGEVLYYGFGTTTSSIVADSTHGFTYQTEFSQKIFQARFGMNYRF